MGKKNAGTPARKDDSKGSSELSREKTDEISQHGQKSSSTKIDNSVGNKPILFLKLLLHIAFFGLHYQVAEIPPALDLVLDDPTIILRTAMGSSTDMHDVFMLEDVYFFVAVQVVFFGLLIERYTSNLVSIKVPKLVQSGLWFVSILGLQAHLLDSQRWVTVTVITNPSSGFHQQEIIQREKQKNIQQGGEDSSTKDVLGSTTTVRAVPKVDGATKFPWKPRTMSVILPCANEHEFAQKTVVSVYDSFPKSERELLKEIIVVDDGSSPPLEQAFIKKSFQEEYNVTVVRHDVMHGLIGAKKDGGDIAKGDILVFFDCHVAPQRDWYKPFFKLIGENYKRIVVPMITDLDIDTWKERQRNNGQAKCYLTFDADFKWFNSQNNEVPILSGGLLGLSRKWWEETGGYDSHMRGWGGENLDQSLRSWLCGGEIINAPTSFVAHMWRIPTDSRTRAKFHLPHDAVNINRFRAAKAWMGAYSDKMIQEFGYNRPPRPDGLPWYGDLSNILSIRKEGLVESPTSTEKKQCREFSWFIWKFKNVYLDGGLVPEYTFMVRYNPEEKIINPEGKESSSNSRSTSSQSTTSRSTNWYEQLDLASQAGKKFADSDIKRQWYRQSKEFLEMTGGRDLDGRVVAETGANGELVMLNSSSDSIVPNFQSTTKKTYKQGELLCLTYMRGAGTSQDGRGTVELKKCDRKNHRQRFHWANLQSAAKTRGIRAWNTDQCLDMPDREGAGRIHTYVCDVSGGAVGQYWGFDAFSNLIKYQQKPGTGAWTMKVCIGAGLQPHRCRKNADMTSNKGSYWILDNWLVPKERLLYEKDWVVNPEMFHQ